jgi:hypothetical protein
VRRVTVQNDVSLAVFRLITSSNFVGCSTRARLTIRPVPTASPVGAITIGISFVACFAALAAGVWFGNDDVNFETNQLRGKTGKEIHLSFHRSKFKDNVLPNDVPTAA